MPAWVSCALGYWWLWGIGTIVFGVLVFVLSGFNIYAALIAAGVFLVVAIAFALLSCWFRFSGR
jgi:hypothetical protein